MKRNGAQPIRPKAHTNGSAREAHLERSLLADHDPKATPTKPEAQVIKPNVMDTLKNIMEQNRCTQWYRSYIHLNDRINFTDTFFMDYSHRTMLQGNANISIKGATYKVNKA